MGMQVPFDTGGADHAEQSIPSLHASGWDYGILSYGHEYAVVSYRDRYPPVPEHRVHRIVGTVDNTTLKFDPPSDAYPKQVSSGQAIEFESDEPFVVRSEDPYDGEMHPFLVFTYMTGSASLEASGAPAEIPSSCA